MITIGLDISLSSTAVTINDFSNEYIFSYLNDDKSNKWANMLNEINNLTINRIKKNKQANNYSDGEIQKLLKYDEISDTIVADILNIVGSRECEIRIEGYSYTKNTNSIIDIIGLSTQLRLKLIKRLNSSIKIISPSTLKKNTCEKAYGITEIEKHGKKGQKLKSEFKIINHRGVSGGSFTKFEIYEAILDGNINTIISNFLKEHKSDIFTLKKIPSPIDDINDSIMLTKIDL